MEHIGCGQNLAVCIIFDGQTFRYSIQVSSDWKQDVRTLIETANGEVWAGEQIPLGVAQCVFENSVCPASHGTIGPSRGGVEPGKILPEAGMISSSSMAGNGR